MPFGVTQNMIDSYGEAIYQLSLNRQRRRGDPPRRAGAAGGGQQDGRAGVHPHIAHALCSDLKVRLVQGVQQGPPQAAAGSSHGAALALKQRHQG